MSTAHHDEGPRQMGHGPDVRAQPLHGLCNPSLNAVYARPGYWAPRVERKVSSVPDLTLFPPGQVRRKQKQIICSHWERGQQTFSVKEQTVNILALLVRSLKELLNFAIVV